MPTDFNSIVAFARDQLAWQNDPSGTDVHRKLLDFVRRIKRVASEGTSSLIEQMRTNDEIYKAFRLMDDQDAKAKERGEPMKIIFPISFAQIQTALAALMSITDKNPFFELTSRQPQGYRNSKLMELELDYQLEQAGWTLIRYQWFKDMLKYGFGCLHVGFERRMNIVRQNRPIPILGNIFPWMTMEQDVLVPGFEGVWFELNDPFTFKFDPSAPLGEPRRWQFCFNTFFKSYNELKLVAEDEGYFNLEKIPERTASILRRGGEKERRLISESALGFIGSGQSVVKGGDSVMVDVCYVKLVPSQYGLSDLDRMQIWKISMANEAVIIQAEPSRFEHGQFPISIIEYDPDRHEILNEGMATTIDGMQRLINWLLNTHIVNVRKVINDVLIVDPSAIDVEDLNQRKPIIKLKTGARAGIDRYIQQLRVQDVTQGHIADVGVIMGILERVTGATSNLQGVGDPKVRTATETSGMVRLALNRMSLLAQLCWDQGIRPLGQQMIQNTQQFVSTDRFLKVTGGLAQALGVDISKLPGGLLKVSPEDLQGFFSIALINATSPSDRLMIASKLQEFLFAAIGNPIAVQLLGLDVSQLATQMLLGYNIRNTTDIIRPPTSDQIKEALAMMQSVGANGSRGIKAQVMPDEQVLDEAQRGNIMPIPEGANQMGAFGL